MFKNILEPGRPQTTIGCMDIARWIHKATNTLSEYVILTAFPLQNSCPNPPQYYVIGTLPVLFKFVYEGRNPKSSW